MSGSVPISDMPHTSNSRSPALKRLRRRLTRVSQKIIRSDLILVTVIAASMTLSAFAVYQATRASDEAGKLLDQSRIVHTEASRQAG